MIRDFGAMTASLVLGDAGELGELGEWRVGRDLAVELTGAPPVSARPSKRLLPDEEKRATGAPAVPARTTCLPSRFQAEIDLRTPLLQQH
jgi:hypothetical protein